MKVHLENTARGLTVALELPNAPLTQVEGAPQLHAKLECAKLGVYQLPDAFLEQIVSKAGIYLADHPEEILEGKAIFIAANAADLLKGRYAQEGWLAYGFVGTPTTLRIDFYNLHDPRKCGLVELGRNFNQLWLKLALLNGPVDTALRFEGRTLNTCQHTSSSALSNGPQYWDLNCIRATCTESRFAGLSRSKYVQGIFDARCYAAEDPGAAAICSYNLFAEDRVSDHIDQVGLP